VWWAISPAEKLTHRIKRIVCFPLQFSAKQTASRTLWLAAAAWRSPETAGFLGSAGLGRARMPAEAPCRMEGVVGHGDRAPRKNRSAPRKPGVIGQKLVHAVRVVEEAKRVASTRRAARSFSPARARGWAMHRRLPPFPGLSDSREARCLEQPSAPYVLSSADSDLQRPGRLLASGNPPLMPRGVRA